MWLMNKFQRQLAADLKKIKNDKNLYVAADKTSNYYRMEVEDYMDLADKAVHKEYKVVEDNVTDQINRIDKGIAIEYELEDRIDILPQSEAFIS